MTPRLIWWRRDKYFQDPSSSYVLVRPLRVSHSNMVQYMEIVLSCQHSLYRDNLILIPHTKNLHQQNLYGASVKLKSLLKWNFAPTTPYMV